MWTSDGRFFPDSLVALPIWILWRLEPDKAGRMTKVPYAGKYDGHASSSNPKTWATFDTVWEKFTKSVDHFGGVGICVQKPDRLLFIDLDHCVDENHEPSEIARDVVSRMKDQFVEVSQSGRGLHILMLGEIPKSFKNSENGVEMYDDRRFVSLTGRAVCKGEPHEDADAVRYVWETYRKPEQEKIIVRHTVSDLERDDRWIIDHAMKRGVFRDLFEGMWRGIYGSQSEADLALCNLLAFWCDCRPDQMDRIFRASGLYREKWNRDDYRMRTISTAIAGCSQTFSEYTRKEGESFERAFLERW